MSLLCSGECNFLWNSSAGLLNSERLKLISEKYDARSGAEEDSGEFAG